MNKSEVCNRPGWTKGRVENFLIVEHIHERRGFRGWYTEYEYSLPQILEAEKSQDWRKSAAKYLSASIEKLDSCIAEILADGETRRIKYESEREALAVGAAKYAADWLVARVAAAAKREAELVEFQRLAPTVRGGLCRIGFPNPLSDNWRIFSVTEVLEYVDFADRRGRIDGSYIREFYRLWSAGAGYCNPKGVLRRLIAPVKNRIVRILLHLARCGGWAHGVGFDGKGNKVIYLDTPYGQVSFHLTIYEGAEYPKYAGIWSGVRNSDEILIQLFDSLNRQ